MSPQWVVGNEFPQPCKQCAGLAGLHYLTCPSLRLPKGGWRVWGDKEEGS